MHGRIRGITGHRIQPMSDGWEIASTTPGAVDAPAGLARASLDWVKTCVPSTAAASLRLAGGWTLDGAPRRFDAEDWWYRCRFSAEPTQAREQVWLCFDGLATVADVWLNDQPLLTSQGMFTAHEQRVDPLLRDDNELVIRFRSLDALLRQRRPRPRWRAPMVENQQIRWFRTTLLGRTPGWSPPAQPVGPWREIRLERRRAVRVEDVRLRADVRGHLDVSCRASTLDGTALGGAEIVLSLDGRDITATLVPSADRLTGHLVVMNARRWWPHTHGEPALYSARLRLNSGDEAIEVDIGKVGFRSVAVDTSDDGFAVHVNGAPVFCRGACWTPLDAVSLSWGRDVLSRAFSQVVDAGMNMLRLGGMMVYEDDAFLDECDARGVLLWQDFMFANMDYPEDDPAFVQTVRQEAEQLLARLQGRPSLAVLCGNSEGEQQAAMWGATRERWRPRLFHEHLAAIALDMCPDVPYWPSSAHGGAFPHQASAGTTSYYGVGAYLRPLEDARRAEVRFASECLAFANIPESRTLVHLPGGAGTKVHDPSWKARTPRDLGAGWDFDDVRDHYASRLYNVDVLQLRYMDHERYLDLGRVATGEVMAAVFSEWRRLRSTTRGGLVWFLRDLWPGAGWGVIDASGTPKAAWYYLKRALAPVAVSLSDEGGNGLGVHVVNDLPSQLDGELEMSLYRFGEVRVAHGVRPVAVAPRSALELNAAAFFDDFLDLSYSYRFGLPSHDVVVVTFRDSGAARGEIRAQAFHFVPGLPSAREMDVGLQAEVRECAQGDYRLIVRTRKLAQSVCIELDGFDPEDNYFHLAPGEERSLIVRPIASNAAKKAFRGTLRALNSGAAVTAVMSPTAAEATATTALATAPWERVAADASSPAAPEAMAAHAHSPPATA